MKKIGIILDTNYFLHFKGPELIPWNELVGEGSIYLLVTDPLSKELDRQKNNKTGKIKERAEKAIKNFYSWFENKESHSFKSDLQIVTLDLFNVEFDSYQLSKDAADDWFIAYALETLKQGPYEDIYLLTNDFGVHNKARKRKIKTLRLDESFRLPDLQSEAEREISALKSQILKLQNRQPNLKVLYADGTQLVEQKVTEIPPFSKADEELVLNQLRRDFKYALKGKSKKTEVTRDDLIKEVASESVHELGKMLVGLTALAGMMAPTQEQLKQYDEELDAYFIDKTKYELTKRQYEAQEARSIRFKLCVRNEGTARATGIKLNMYFPVSKACQLLTVKDFEKKRPKEPMPPEYPKHKFYTGADLLTRDLYIPKDLHRMIQPTSNVSSPRITPTNSFDVDFKIEDLLHTQTDFIDEMILIFSSVEEAQSFTVSYSVICPEIAEAIEGELHAKVLK